MKKPSLVFLLVAAAVALLFASCGKSFTFESTSLISYAEAGAGQDALALNLCRDRGVVFGSWEAPSWGRYGLVEGEVKADGGLSLRLYAASTAGPVGGIVGKYADVEQRIEGKISFGKENPRSIGLKALPAVTEGLSPGRVEATSRENLDKGVLNPTRFIYVGFEPTAPAEFARWYRATFQGGRSLKDAMAREKDAFLEDFKSTGAGLKAQAADIDIAPWSYEGRQLLSYRGKGLLVMGLRRQSYTGGKDSSSALRYAVIDEKETRLLGPDDFLNPGWREGLSPLLASTAREELGLEDSESLMAAGLNTDKPEPSGDFFVYSQGIGFHYVPGELAPEAAGDFFLLVPFDRLGAFGKAETLSRFGLSAMPRPVLLSAPASGEAASGAQPEPSGSAPGGGSK